MSGTMSKTNACLRRTFTAFNVFFAIVGALIISLTFLHQVFSNFQGGENVRVGVFGLYIVGTVTMLVASLGAYGAHRESRLSLSVFLGFMVTGSLLMLIYGIPVATARTQWEEVIKEDLRSFVPLDQAPEQIRSVVDTLQSQVHCCGLFSYTDWANGVPESCRCSPTEDNRQMNRAMVSSDTMCHAESCLPFIMDGFRLMAGILLAVLFSLAGLAILGTILSSIMIHQMTQRSRPPIVFQFPPTFVPAPPKYEKLQEDPPAYC